MIIPEGKSNGEFFDIELEAGASTVVKGVFGNGSAVPVQAVLYAADVIPAVNGGFAMGDAETPVTEPTTWLDFPTIPVDFDAGEAFELSFSVSVPIGTPPGQYITGVTVETAEATTVPGESGILVKYRLATPVLITVPGEVTPRFDVSDVGVSVDEFTTTIVGTIENTGNIRVRPAGNLILTNESGVEVVNARIDMRSVYAGQTTTFEVSLPTPIPTGVYSGSLVLEDSDTGATAEIETQTITVVAPDAPKPIEITAATITPMPSAENLVFAQVSATITNTGQPVSGIELELVVSRDGEEVDRVVLGSSITLQTGETIVNQPYIPADGNWESGEYTFALSLTSTDPQSGSKTSIDTTEIDTVIEAP